MNQVAIDAEGLEEEIRCTMCRNPMHTVRGCDGNCLYDEKLYDAIIRILNKRTISTDPQWILCSVRKPKKDGTYLVSGIWGSGKEAVGECDFNVEDGYFDASWNFTPVAWTYMPTPYRGDCESEFNQ